MDETLRKFDGPCPSCEKGQMKITLFQNYPAKYKGAYPFIVPEAYISICDTCDERMVSAQELKRWDALFLEQLTEHQAFLTPSEIADLRESLGLNQKDFALLIGVTPKSLRGWEKSEQPHPASRSADLLMKLLRASLQSGSVDALSIVLDEASKWGVPLQVQRPMPQQEAEAAL